MTGMKPKCLVLLLFLAVLPVDAFLCEYAVIVTYLLADIMFLFAFVLLVCLQCLTIASSNKLQMNFYE